MVIPIFFYSMEPEAEQNCDQLLTLALQVDPTNPEVLQCLASVRMSQQREAEASDLVLQAWSLWKDLPPGSSFSNVHDP